LKFLYNYVDDIESFPRQQELARDIMALISSFSVDRKKKNEDLQNKQV